MMVAALHEFYDYDWTPEQRVFIHLVERYHSRLPQRYLDRIEEWRPEAKKRASEMFKKLLCDDNPMLRMIPQHT